MTSKTGPLWERPAGAYTALVKAVNAKDLDRVLPAERVDAGPLQEEEDGKDVDPDDPSFFFPGEAPGRRIQFPSGSLHEDVVERVWDEIVYVSKGLKAARADLLLHGQQIAHLEMLVTSLKGLER